MPPSHEAAKLQTSSIFCAVGRIGQRFIESCGRYWLAMILAKRHMTWVARLRSWLRTACSRPSHFLKAWNEQLPLQFICWRSVDTRYTWYCAAVQSPSFKKHPQKLQLSYSTYLILHPLSFSASISPLAQHTSCCILNWCNWSKKWKQMETTIGENWSTLVK